MQSASMQVYRKKIICSFGKCRMDKEFLERNATNKCCLFRKNLDSFFHFVEGSISLNLPSCLRKKKSLFLVHRSTILILSRKEEREIYRKIESTRAIFSQNLDCNEKESRRQHRIEHDSRVSFFLRLLGVVDLFHGCTGESHLFRPGEIRGKYRLIGLHCSS